MEKTEDIYSVTTREGHDIARVQALTAKDAINTAAYNSEISSNEMQATLFVRVTHARRAIEVLQGVSDTEWSMAHAASPILLVGRSECDSASAVDANDGRFVTASVAGHLQIAIAEGAERNVPASNWAAGYLFGPDRYTWMFSDSGTYGRDEMSGVTRTDVIAYLQSLLAVAT